MTMHTEKQIFRVGDSYKLLWKHLLPDVHTTEYRCAFNSIHFNRIKNLVSLCFVKKHLHNELLDDSTQMQKYIVMF